jgi:quercetin dioxygenase-like cupin family protein
MNISALHTEQKGVSTAKLFSHESGSALAMQILAGEQLKEHITKTPALLLCISGQVIFKNEKGIKETLLSGDYVEIEPMVKHWVNGIGISQLVLLK